ncbi:unnamed protein product [Prunus brigantina]
MGTCFSKKKRSSSPLPLPPPAATGYGYVVGEDPNDNKNKPKSVSVVPEPGRVEMKAKKPERKQEQIEEEDEDQETPVQVKKEVFIIKHRKSHDGRGDRDCGKSPLPQNQIQQQPSVSDGGADVAAASASASPPTPQIANSSTKTGTCNELVDDVDKVVKRVRTQSCNKEELDAILLQCGRLSRSNSSGHNRRYSGSKRSYDFDAVDGQVNVNEICHEDADADGMSAADKIHRHRQSSRSRPSSPSSQGRRRRRTPSRERNQQQQQQRSSSRERRTSRSPSKRSSSQQNPSASSSSNANANANGNNRPGKMVSVPAAAISSVATMEKTTHINNGESAATIKRISVKRNVGSPRAQSPARANARGAPNEGQQQQQPSLSRSSSRKAEQSPYRRNPLAEIDPNSLAYAQAHTNNRTKREIQTEEDIPVKEPTNLLNQAPMQKPNLEINNNRTVPHGVNYITSGTSTMDSNKAMSANCSSKERQQNVPAEEAKGQPQGKPQTLTRSRSSRRSRDLDFDPETATLSNPAAPSLYTSLLLQDIHNFHQQNTPNVVSVPLCVTKACSILEAVADLNSATKSTPTDQINKKTTPGSGYNCSLNANYNVVGKSIADQPKDPFVESEVVVNDDLMEPSFHKYVTVRRGTGALEGGGLLDMEDQESSGSNSFVSGTSHSQQHHWGLSSSSWEPNSADSTDSWTSRSNTREEGPNHRITPLSLDGDEAARRRLSGRKRDSDDHNQRSSGIGRGRLAATNTKGLHTIPGVAAAASM